MKVGVQNLVNLSENQGGERTIVTYDLQRGSLERINSPSFEYKSEDLHLTGFEFKRLLCS
jgi:hypothetical protein